MAAHFGVAKNSLLAVLVWSVVVVLVGAEDRLVQIVLKQPVNVVSDEFVSFAMDPADVMNASDRMVEKLSTLMNSFTPAYLKISGTNTNKLVWETTDGEGALKVNAKALETFSRWTNSVGLKTVWTLPYEPSIWTPRDVINVLDTARSSGTTDCIWQLGSDFNVTDPIRYVDDLNTLRQMSDAFGVSGWGVIGADISPASDQDQSRFYIEMAQHVVDSMGWTRSSEDSMDPISGTSDQSARVLQHCSHPLWLNFDARSLVPCTKDCTAQGLEWAYTLGTSAQQGFSTVFQRIFNQDILNPTLSAYVSALHKKLMGNQVFDTRILSGSSKYDRKQLFTHCSRNISGAFTVMGVNFSMKKEKVSTKMPIKSTGSLVLQYVLTTNAYGIVLVNGESVHLGGQVEPIIKTKKPNRLTSFLLQEQSVSFWVFPNANVPECYDTSGLTLYADQQNSQTSFKTSSEKLLQELIIESVQKSSDSSLNRQKRHLVVKKDFLRRTEQIERPKRFLPPSDVKSQYRLAKSRSIFRPSIIRAKRQLNPKLGNIFEKFELRKNKQFQLPSLFKKGPLSIPPVVSTIQDVYKVDSNEDLFKSSENVDLPKGDVYLEVGEDKSPDYEYIAVDDQPKKAKTVKSTNKSINTHFDDFDDVLEDDSELTRYPNQLLEGYPNEDVIYHVPAPQSRDWETKSYSAPIVSGNGFGDSQYDAGKIVQAVEPSWKVNQMNLRKAKNDLEHFYMDHGTIDKPKARKVKVVDSREDFFST